MCGIFGSFDKNKIFELAELNAYRGQHSYSIAAYSIEHEIIIDLERSLGEFNFGSPIFNTEQAYFICHIQAPTTEARDISSVHPATFDENYLWHNGILKDSTISKLQERYGKDIKWDTKLLLHHMWFKGSPNGIDGSFSCIWYDFPNSHLYHFRNEISPMFHDEQLNISSTKFPDSKPTPPNQVLEFDFNTKSFKMFSTFETVNNPYYFG